MKDSRYDIEPGRKPNFKADLAYGHIGEEIIKNFLDVLVNGSIEIKRDSYRNRQDGRRNNAETS